jgi:hypothetical protein
MALSEFLAYYDVRGADLVGRLRPARGGLLDAERRGPKQQAVAA